MQKEHRTADFSTHGSRTPHTSSTVCGLSVNINKILKNRNLFILQYGTFTHERTRVHTPKRHGFLPQRTQRKKIHVQRTSQTKRHQPLRRRTLTRRQRVHRTSSRTTKRNNRNPRRRIRNRKKRMVRPRPRTRRPRKQTTTRRRLLRSTRAP